MKDVVDARLFSSAAWHYARYRPSYDEKIINRILGFCGSISPRVAWDLGCGTGGVAMPLARKVGKIFAIDPEPEMLDEARYAARDAGVENVVFIDGKAEDISVCIPPPQLVVMADSFHWMDRKQVLNMLARRLDAHGVIAIIVANLMGTNESTDKFVGNGFVEEREEVTPEWKKVLREAMEDWCGQSSWRCPTGWQSLDDGINRSDWAVEKAVHPEIWIRTLDELVGLCLSFSWCSPEKLGDRQAAFVADVRKRLLAVQPDNQFVESTRRRILVLRALHGARATPP